MKSIDCPSGQETAENCAWQARKGSIRDFPEYGVVECSTCHLVSHERDLREFIDYESGTMHSWAAGYGGTLEIPKEDVSRRVNAIRKLAQSNPIKTILDFGSGNGEMIQALSEFFNVNGLEPEAQARNNCISAGMKVLPSAEEFSSKSVKFDCITLFHVVEHFYRPNIELSRIFELLEPGGILIIETPSAEDALLTFYESEAFSHFTYWSHHPMLHSSLSLTNLVRAAGFEKIEARGIQRYGLANHLYWMSHQRPGGHIHWQGRFSQNTESSYAADLIESGTADTIWLEAFKLLP